MIAVHPKGTTTAVQRWTIVVHSAQSQGRNEPGVARRRHNRAALQT